MSRFLSMVSVTKDFPGVRALSGVTFSADKGEIHALVGENGAGKSTLMKILGGVYADGTFEGELFLDGKKLRLKTVRDAEKAGIAVIHQELALAKQLSVCENILLGHEMSRGGVIDWEKSYEKARKALALVGLEVEPSAPVSGLGVGKQQLVEIAKALSKEARVLILDEPTAALSETEAENLLGILRRLRDSGVTCLYISHRLKEVLSIADTITVLRDGKTVRSAKKTEYTEEKLISDMVGRELSRIYPARNFEPGETVFELDGWKAEGAAGFSVEAGFKLRRGEILGLAGLVGAGRTELAMSLFGLWGNRVSGRILVDGKEIVKPGPAEALRRGLCLASEDRKRYGLVLEQSVKTNITLASLEKISRAGVIDHSAETGAASEYAGKLRVKTPSLEQKTANLSGGNQQKVVLSKWLMTNPKALILDEPTRGIDVGARLEIYEIINSLAAAGAGILLISSDLEEILGMCGRLLVMRGGKISGEFNRESASQREIMRCAATEA